MNKEIWNFNVKVHNYYYQIQYINNAPRETIFLDEILIQFIKNPSKKFSNVSKWI